MPGANVQWGAVLTRLNPWYPGQMGVPGTDDFNCRASGFERFE